MISQANAVETALQSAIGNAGNVISELFNRVNIPMAQIVKGKLIDNDFLLEISLQFQDIADGIILYLLNSSPFFIYKSRLID